MSKHGNIDFPKLKELFTQFADEDVAKGMSAYMKNRFAFFGIKTPNRRLLARQFFAGDKKTDPIDWVFVFACFDADGRELQYAALDYMERHKGQLKSTDLANIKQLILTKSWWDTVDCIDGFVGYLALKDSSINQTLLEWSIDENFWLRRIAIDHQLQRKDKTDTELLSTIIKNNLNQTEFFIGKAIGWALREYSKTNPEWVRNFIAENKDNMASLSIREASKYLK